MQTRKGHGGGFAAPRENTERSERRRQVQGVQRSGTEADAEIVSVTRPLAAVLVELQVQAELHVFGERARLVVVVRVVDDGKDALCEL